ncbi:MAG: TM0996/MTH895 family glutaredoxin-like protein [Bacilli bacterium]|nr:TM0996/MTH895 family glutaredoxin-like protein [Bacilli bacterium]MBN2696090.1 TM0996/MTH895 family glutaredoxin-like protein [Bacilli bacterium]
MVIKVLGTGCKNCRNLLENVERSVSELGIAAEVLYITDLVAIANSGLMKTPGLIIGNKIVVSGRVPTVEEIKKYIEQI